MSSTRQANQHHVTPAGESADQPLNRVFERYRFSQADLARELGVTRQAIQKMIAAGAERQGTADRGSSGFDITDHGGDLRDEAGQAWEITECLDIFGAGGADTAFVQTFL